MPDKNLPATPRQSSLSKADADALTFKAVDRSIDAVSALIQLFVHAQASQIERASKAAETDQYLRQLDAETRAYMLRLEAELGKEKERTAQLALLLHFVHQEGHTLNEALSAGIADAIRQLTRS